MRFIIDNRPDDWESMEKLYDPEGMYKQRYQESKMQGDDEENKDKNWWNATVSYLMAAMI